MSLRGVLQKGSQKRKERKKEIPVLESSFNNIVDLQVAKSVLLLEIDSATGGYLWIIGSSIEHHF